MINKCFCVILLLLCLVTGKVTAQNLELPRGCDDATWNRIVAIKQCLDCGKVFSMVPELEMIYDNLFRNDKKIDSKAKLVATYTLTNAYISQGEYLKADSILSLYNLDNKDYSRDEILLGKQSGNQFANFRRLFLVKGNLLSVIDSYDMSKKYFEMAKAMFIKSKDTHSIEYFYCLIDLFFAYFDNDDFVLAKAHLDAASRLLEETNNFNGNEYSYCIYLISSGHFAIILGNIVRAKECFEQALEICKRCNFDSKEYLASALMGFYGVGLENTQLDDLFSQNNILLDDTPSLERQIFYELLFQLQQYGDAQDQTQIISKYNSSFRENVGKIFSAFSALEAESWWGENAVKSVLFNNFEAERHIDNNQLQIDAYDNVLFTKTFLLRRKKMIDKINNEKGDYFYDYGKRLISNTNDVTLMSDLRNEVSQYEKYLLLSSPELRDSIKNYKPSCNSIIAALDKQDAAIEFSLIGDSTTDYFCAFVLRHDKAPKPKLIKLCDYNELYNMFEGMQDEEEETDQSHKARRDGINAIYDNADIYNKLWKPIEDSGLLRGVKNVFYAPVGDINKINLAALSLGGDGKKRLRDKYTFREVMSTIDVVEIKQLSETLEKEQINYVCAVGDIDYGQADDDLGENAVAIRAMASRGKSFRKLKDRKSVV